MNNMMIITLFDSLYPCWTEEMLAKEGVDLCALRRLVREGLVEEADGVFSLSSAGAEEFRRLAIENFIEAAPREAPKDRRRAARAGAFTKLLDGAHRQRWGLKEYYTSKRLDIYPKAEGAELFAVDGEELKWSYLDSPEELELESLFPLRGIEGRMGRMASEAERGLSWLSEKRADLGSFSADLAYICRYDYMQYASFKGHPADLLGYVNADRFLFVFCDTEDEELEAIGRFRLWADLQRRVLLPGFFDIDTLEQDSISWLTLISRTEGEAEESAKRLSRFGSALTAGADPLEIWTISEEALEGVKDKREIIWELLPDTAHPVCRTTACCCRV